LLSDERQDVTHFVTSGEALVYAVLEPPAETSASATDYPAVSLSAEARPKDAGTLRYFGKNLRMPARLLSIRRGSPWLAQPQLSPDGRWAVLVGSAAGTTVPRSWHSYRWADALPELLAMQFLLVDLRTLETTPMLDAPIGDPTRDRSSYTANPYAVWSKDSRYVFLVNTALPISGEAPERQSEGYVVAYEISSGTWSVLEPFHGRSGERTRIGEVTILPGRTTRLAIERTTQTFPEKPVARTLYTLRRGRWIGSEDKQLSEPPRAEPYEEAPTIKLVSGVTVRVHESANTPPNVLATIRDRTLPLLPPDPALQGVWRAPVQAISWQEEDGRTVNGGLMLPRNFAIGHPVPLVIEAYYWSPNDFRPSGEAHTVYGGQALVSHGIAVLALPIPAVDQNWRDKIGTAEGDWFVRRLDTAINKLVDAGYVDPSRVGLSGFSRGGMGVFHAITNPQKVDFAAAVVGDTAAYAFGQYVYWGSYSDLDRGILGGFAEDQELVMGGGFWGPAHDAWLARDPMLNADRGRAALLVAEASSDPWQARLWLGAFRLNRRPLEYLLLPRANHQYQRPREQEAAMQATVDWMGFWLLGREDSDPAKVAQNARWRRMREQNDQRQFSRAQTGVSQLQRSH